MSRQANRKGDGDKQHAAKLELVLGHRSFVQLFRDGMSRFIDAFRAALLSHLRVHEASGIPFWKKVLSVHIRVRPMMARKFFAATTSIFSC
jgi:hypothetical protein